MPNIKQRNERCHQSPPQYTVPSSDTITQETGGRGAHQQSTNTISNDMAASTGCTVSRLGRCILSLDSGGGGSSCLCVGFLRRLGFDVIGVRPLMPDQRALPCKPLLTNLAREGTLSGMKPQMAREVRRIRKPLTTLRTAQRLLARVDTLVTTEARSSCKPLTALLTREWFPITYLARMNAKMGLQVVAPREHLGALRALIRPFDAILVQSQGHIRATTMRRCHNATRQRLRLFLL